MLKRSDTSSRSQIIIKAIPVFLVLGPTYDKLWSHSSVFRKGSFNFLLEERVISPKVQKSSSKWDRSEI